MSSALLYALLVLPGCSGETVAPPPEPVKPVDVPSGPAPSIALEELKAAAQNIALVPSPAEMQKAMEKAGIVEGLSKLVVERKLRVDVENKDVVAVRTGVILADALLTVRDAPKEKLIERLTTVKVGLTALGAGADISATIDDLNARIGNDGISRDDLVKELDEMHGAIIPEIKFEAGERCVPLLQAGSWLEGSNLVASAIINANKPEAASQLLRQPQVADYFLKYVQVEGSGKAPDEVIKQLDATLHKLKDIAAQPTLSADDVKTIKSETDAVLALL